MRTTTLDGNPLYVLDQMPNWAKHPKLTFSVVNFVSNGATGVELRRALDTKFRIQSRVDIVAQGAAARRMEDALSTIRTERVAFPFWPAARKYSDASPQIMTGGVSLTYLEDWSSWQVFTESTPPWLGSSDANVVPLIIGRLTDTGVEWVTPSLMRFAVNHKEQSPVDWALDPGDYDFTPGPLPSASYPQAPYLFPGVVNYISPDASWETEVNTIQIGQGRVPLDITDQPKPVRKLSAEYVAQGKDEIGRLLKFFLDHAAGKSCWVPGLSSAVEMTGNLLGGDVVFSVEDSGSLAAGDWLAFKDSTGLRYGQVASTTSTTVTLVAEIGPVTEGQTLVTRLLLVRMNSPKVEVEFLAPLVARFSMTFRDLADEYNPASDEFLGVTMGYAWTKVMLYRIWQMRGGVELNEYLTSHSNDVESRGALYVAGNIDSGDITQGTALDKDNVRIRCNASASPLLTSVALRKAYGPVFVSVSEASITRLAEFDREYAEDFQ